MNITIGTTSYTLLHQKALLQPDNGLLIIADVHLGKASHFRKEGISISANAQQADYGRLNELFHVIGPRRVLFLGDLFHSRINNDWMNFVALVALWPEIDFTLVRGNHDLIHDRQFEEVGVRVTDMVEDVDCIYTHEPMTVVPAGKTNIVGHIHPGVLLTGAAKQSVRLPCFYQTANRMILPAFGTLTGLQIMPVEKGATIYGVLPDSVRKIG